MKAKRLSKAQRLSKARRGDIISTLPQSIIETILCLLPVEEAVRMSILSREWKYKWTTIPKLVFFRSTVKEPNEEWHLSNGEQISDLEVKRRDKEMRCKLFCAIHQVLLQHQGSIHDFTLSMDANESCFEIDQIIHHLSRNHKILKLKLDLSNYSLPMSLFSMHQLLDLSLKNCDINHKPVFNGFGCLTNLSLDLAWISIESLLHLLSLCPSLKSLCLFVTDDYLWDYKTPTIMDFFKCLPVIEQLTTSRNLSEYGLRISVPEELTASLIHLKYFCFKDMSVSDNDGWPFLMLLIQCSPNLEKIKLKMYTDFVDVEKSVMFEEYVDVWLEHLIELEVEDFGNYKSELEFLKFILARSPKLKKVILLTWMVDKDDELEMLKVLLSATRASPVKIIVTNRCGAQ